MMNNELQETLTAEGYEGYELKRVSGGDINDCYQLRKGKQQYFIKVNFSEKFPGMFEREAEALKFLAEHSSFKIPGVIHLYSGNTYQWLLLEWVERGIADNHYWILAGEKLAEMHLKSQHSFGWPKANYIGSLEQKNHVSETWPSFYSVNRLLPLSVQLKLSGLFSESDLKQMERLCERLSDFFPEEQPSLLHGDLWSGNIMPVANGVPCIYDPAVYFGHREMDIGMTLLFGGFPKEFYDAYESVYPLAKGWERRVPLTQLYPLLVHAVLFGGSYVASVKTILRNFS